MLFTKQQLQDRVAFLEQEVRELQAQLREQDKDVLEETIFEYEELSAWDRPI